MAIQCNCADSGSAHNFGGVSDCANGIGLSKNAILMVNDKADGTSNGLDVVNDTINTVLMDGKFKAQLETDRWLFLEGIKQVTAAPIDPNTEEVDDITVTTSENPKEVSFTIVTMEAFKLAAKLNSHACRPISIIWNDDLDNLVGDLNGDIFQGRKIQAGSFRAVVIEAEFGVTPKVQVTFKYDIEALESNVDYIKQANMNGYSVRRDAISLIDVRIINMVATTTGIAFDLVNDFGDAVTRIGAGGLTATELDFYNVTDDNVEPVTGGIVEGVLGSYTATWTSATAVGEVMEVRGIGGVNYVQKKYDLKGIKDKTVVTA